MFDKTKKKVTDLISRKSTFSDDEADTNITHWTADPGISKLATLVASGATVKNDATKLLYFLATYGEGDRLGKYVFTSGELVGLPMSKKRVGESVVDIDAVAPTEKLALSGPRLNDAANFLEGKQWAKLTRDGEFGVDTSFHEVSLTNAGRVAAQGAVKNAVDAGPDASTSGFALDPFSESPRKGKERPEREQFLDMLTRAKISFSVEHTEDDDTITTVSLDHGIEFTFDDAGLLVGCGVDE